MQIDNPVWGQKVFSIVNAVRYNTSFQRKSRETISKRKYCIDMSFCMLKFRLFGKILYCKFDLRLFIYFCFFIYIVIADSTKYVFLF